MTGAIRRYPVAIGSAAVITFLAFFLMQALISTGKNPFTEEVQGRVVDFIRLQKQDEVQHKDRKPERPPAPEKPPPQPDVPQQRLTAAKVDQSLAIGAVNADVDLNVEAGLEAGGGSDGEYLPIVKVAPVFPQRALSRGIEGWVLVEFTVSGSGAVKDVKVIDADPKGYFEDAAKEAAMKFRYKPRVVNGKPVEVAGVQNLIRFELER